MTRVSFVFTFTMLLYSTLAKKVLST